MIMLYLKCKKAYRQTGTGSKLKVGDIVTYSRTKTPESVGVRYFVLKIAGSEGELLTLQNMQSLRIVKYNLIEQRFIF